MNGKALYPVNVHAERNVLGVCEVCGVLRMLPDEAKNKFPESGWWVECPVCKEYRYFLKVEANVRVIDTRIHPHHHPEEAEVRR